jgi:hypothetical protein
MAFSVLPNGKHALMVVLRGCNETFDQFGQFDNPEDAAAKLGIQAAIPDAGTQHFGNDIDDAGSTTKRRTATITRKRSSG